MFTAIIVKLLRFFSNQAKNAPMIPLQHVRIKKEVLVDTFVQPTYISFYYPLGVEQKKFPVYINFHGGAFIMNEKEMDDPYCRFLANQTGCVVINVDYAKAPEHPFPKPIEQGYEIIQWMKRKADDLNINPEKVMLGGQSSGANIAAALCLYLEEKQVPQSLLQVLACPILDFVTPHADKPEPDKWRSRYPQAASFLNMCYVPEKGQAKHPLASPVCADISDHLATALILIAEYDAFRPETELYFEKLRAAGVNVQAELFTDCSHAFTHFGPRAKAEEAWKLIAKKIKEAVESHEN